MKKEIEVSEIIRLRKIGKTFEEIGEQFGVSRQRIHQIWCEIEDRGKVLLDGLKSEIIK